jgi:hypothetical protein
MSTDWENSTCETCKFQKAGKCRKNPPVLVYRTYLTKSDYPAVERQECYTSACSQYIM